MRTLRTQLLVTLLCTLAACGGESGGGEATPADAPAAKSGLLVEYPGDGHASPASALNTALQEAISAGNTESWLVFSVEGAPQNGVPRRASVRYRSGELDLGQWVPSLEHNLEDAGIDVNAVQIHQGFKGMTMHSPSAARLAALLDNLFTSHYKIRPIPELGTYKIRAEWN